MEVIFKKTDLPQKPEELGPFLADTRAAMVASGRMTKDKFEEVAGQIKAAVDSVEECKRANKKVAELEESLKALHEAGRIHSDDGVERQLRALPVLRRVKDDEDYRGQLPDNLFNILALTRMELKTYLSGSALDWALRFRRLNNAVLSAHQLMTIASSANPTRAERYIAQGGIKGTQVWSALQETFKQGARALNIGSAGGVAEWVPTLYSADRFDDVRDKLQAANMVRWLPMPQSPWTIPVLLGFMTAYVISETTSNAVPAATALTASDPTSGNVTLTAKKFATLSWFSREIEQDSIISILPMYDQEEVYAQSVAIEQAVVNGQLTATIDTGSAPAATDPRANVDGFRRSASLIGSSVDLAAGLTAERLAAAIAIAGKYADPQKCAFLTGYLGMARALVLKDGNGNLVYLTREKAGDNATLFSAQVGILMGYPLVCSGVYPQNMNAAGIIDGVTTNRTGMLFMNTDPWLGGHRQGLEREVTRDERFSSDQIGVRSIQRAAFKPLLTASATRPFAVPLVGLA